MMRRWWWWWWCVAVLECCEGRWEVVGIISDVCLTDVQSAGDPAMRNLAVNLLLVTTPNSAALCSGLLWSTKLTVILIPSSAHTQYEGFSSHIKDRDKTLCLNAHCRVNVSRAGLRFGFLLKFMLWCVGRWYTGSNQDSIPRWRFSLSMLMWESESLL